MALETKLLQKLSQSLLMTPQLQQAIKLLQLGRLEYKEAIERELLENPALEEMREEGDTSNSPPRTAAEPSEPTILSATNGESGNSEPTGDEFTPAQESRADWDDYLESFTDYRGSANAKGADYEDRQPPEVVATTGVSLQSHLFEQIRMSDLSSEVKPLAQYVAGNLNRDGYLDCSYEEIAEACECSVEQVADIIDSLRFFDPPGVCARDLKECLMTQLEARGYPSGLEARIVNNHLERVEKRKLESIAKEEGVPLSEVIRAVGIIRTLDPRPGRPFSDETTRYIVPDVYVQKVGGEYVITLNEDGLPKLRVSPYYMDLVKDPESAGATNKTYLTERLRAAQWLIKSIHQRQQTIFRVAESIVKFQREFLDHGIDRLKPLVLKDVADDIGMHESTVSRVTTEKYIHTPQGVFELKFFFTSGIKTASGDISSSSVKERIKHIIGQESAASPISDQQIVEMLKQEKIDIARRTVAKYREGLNIPASSQRKKLF